MKIQFGLFEDPNTLVENIGVGKHRAGGYATGMLQEHPQRDRGKFRRPDRGVRKKASRIRNGARAAGSNGL